MTSTETSDTRAAFEKWAREQPDLATDMEKVGIVYNDACVHYAWKAWNAALTHAASQLPPLDSDLVQSLEAVQSELLALRAENDALIEERSNILATKREQMAIQDVKLSKLRAENEGLIQKNCQLSEGVVAIASGLIKQSDAREFANQVLEVLSAAGKGGV